MINRTIECCGISVIARNIQATSKTNRAPQLCGWRLQSACNEIKGDMQASKCGERMLLVPASRTQKVQCIVGSIPV